MGSCLLISRLLSTLAAPPWAESNRSRRGFWPRKRSKRRRKGGNRERLAYRRGHGDRGGEEFSPRKVEGTKKTAGLDRSAARLVSSQLYRRFPGRTTHARPAGQVLAYLLADYCLIKHNHGMSESTPTALSKLNDLLNQGCVDRVVQAPLVSTCICATL